MGTMAFARLALFVLCAGLPARSEDHVADSAAAKVGARADRGTTTTSELLVPTYRPSDQEILAVTRQALAGKKEEDVPKSKLDLIVRKLRFARERRALPPEVDALLDDAKKSLPKRVNDIKRALALPSTVQKVPQVGLPETDWLRAADAVAKLRRGGTDGDLEKARKALRDLGIGVLPYVEAEFFVAKDFDVSRRLEIVRLQLLKDFQDATDRLLTNLPIPKQMSEAYSRLAENLLPEKLAFRDVNTQATLIRRELARLARDNDVGGYRIVVNALIRHGFEHDRQPIRDATSKALAGEVRRKGIEFKTVLEAALTAAKSRKDVEARARATEILEKLD